MEGALFENAAYAGQMMRSEQMKDVLTAEAAARHGLPHQVIQELVQPTGGLPAELQGSGQRAQDFFASEAARHLQGQQIERMRQQQGIDQAAAVHGAAVGVPFQPLQGLHGQMARVQDFFRNWRQQPAPRRELQQLPLRVVSAAVQPPPPPLQQLLQALAQVPASS